MKIKGFIKCVSRAACYTLLAAAVLSIGLFSLPASAQSKQSKQSKNNSPTQLTLHVQAVAKNLQAPTAMVFPGIGEAWITEQSGKIRVMKNGTLADEPLMDLKKMLTKMNPGYEERGLLGIALHPQFATNKKFYIVYSTPSTPSASSGQKPNHTEVLAEYVMPAGSYQVDPNSGRIILTAEKPGGNHNGGCIQFGPDGYLYLSFGDGGGQHDQHGEIGNGQNLNTWLGKILRINVNTTSGYTVPADNPFVGRADVKPEIWAYGFRNVWRFSFDKTSGQLFAGDVGQDLWEEVDIVTKGANCGWRIMEGTHCHNPAAGCDTTGITMPISEYPHKEGLSITGGFVYNGKSLPALRNKYVFADWTGPVFYLTKSGAAWSRGKITLQNIPEGTRITSFSQDSSGELYIMTNPETGPDNKNGTVYKIVK
ncbi:MAG: PQQ-dependent sugar dehydrogenase [Chitinophagaceae bacterium]